MGKTPLYDFPESTHGRGRKIFNIEGPYSETYTRVNPRVGTNDSITCPIQALLCHMNIPGRVQQSRQRVA
jgi:hypothetical protein